MEAKIEASRETGMFPFSTDSRMRRSVGSSVLLSLSAVSAMKTARRLFRLVFGSVKVDLAF